MNLLLRPMLFSVHGSCYLSIKCLCLCSPQYRNLLENCCGMREGSILILLCDICEYLTQLPAFKLCACASNILSVWLSELAAWLVSCSMEEIIAVTSIVMSSLTLNHQTLSHHGDSSPSDRGLRQQSYERKCTKARINNAFVYHMLYKQVWERTHMVWVTHIESG